jgi:subtilisin family serine protease
MGSVTLKLVVIIAATSALPVPLETQLSSSCVHGSAGYLILLRKPSLPGARLADPSEGSSASQYASKLQALWRRRRLQQSESFNASANEVTREYRNIDGLAARLDGASLEFVEGDPEVELIEADCNVVIDPAELEAAPDATQQDAAWGLDRIDADPAEQLEATPDATQQDAVWGLDRIDARSGRDGAYSYGAATGDKATVYVLDTGIRISHSDFGGRARRGYSAGCATGTESGCGSSYLFEGVIDDSSSTCSDHGTHCASTVGGTTYGVAKAANIVAVQVLSCTGSGPTSGIVAAIDWTIGQAAQRPDEKAIASTPQACNL